MRFDYGQSTAELLIRIMDENNSRLSRSHHGISDTSVSEAKRPLQLSGAALRQRAKQNELQVQHWIFEIRTAPAPADGNEVQQLLFTIADTTNAGLLPAGRFRTWDVPYARAAEPSGSAERVQPVAWQHVPDAVAEFSTTVFSHWQELATDPVPLAAWVEWQLNPGPLHPFYDGCGRIARSFAALLLVRSSWLLPLYDDRSTYFQIASQGLTEFVPYVRHRIAACRQWIDNCGSASCHQFS